MADYSRLLSDPPVSDTRLLELSLRWTGLSGGQARMADLLRVFVITWDPLELDDARPPAFGTANSDELCVYVPFWSLEELAERRGTDAAEVLGWLGGCAVVTAAGHHREVIAGRYARLVASGEVPDLLAGALEGGTGEAMLGSPTEIQVESDGWDPVGLGAITDIVQQAYGPVAYDRSLVELTTLPAPRQGCPACAGRRFNFPADLNEQAAYMCDPHQKEAQRVTRQRTVRAEQSNRRGWNAITDACIRLQRPILPSGLAPKIRAQIDKPGPELLRLLVQAKEVPRPARGLLCRHRREIRSCRSPATLAGDARARPGIRESVCGGARRGGGSGGLRAAVVGTLVRRSPGSAPRCRAH